MKVKPKESEQNAALVIKIFQAQYSKQLYCVIIWTDPFHSKDFITFPLQNNQDVPAFGVKLSPKNLLLVLSDESFTQNLFCLLIFLELFMLLLVLAFLTLEP